MLIPLQDLREIVTTVMAGRDYLSAGPYRCRDETGWLPLAPLPEDQGLRLSDFLTAIAPLPDPCPAPDAAIAICKVIRDRGHRFLLSELDAQWAARWPEPEQDAPDASPSPGSASRCQVCSKPLPAGSRASRRTCGDNCRQKLRQRRGAP